VVASCRLPRGARAGALAGAECASAPPRSARRQVPGGGGGSA
jgi:hypothetical protein